MHLAKNHFVPKLIIKRFSSSDGKIIFYSKRDKSISNPIPYEDQLQKRYFYSKKSLSELKKDFDHIVINPLFKDVEKTLEENLSLNVEDPMERILKRIVEPLLNGQDVKLFSEETSFIKKYIEIQHVRTTQFKEIGKEIHKDTLKLPPNISELIMNQEHKREPDIKRIIKEKRPELNHKARRKLEIEWRKKLKKNPRLLEEIRNSDKSKSFLEDEINKVEDKLEMIRNSPDKHSSEVIDTGLTDRFLKGRGLDKNNLRFVINDTLIPFVLTDTGIVVMCWDYGEKKELRVYLPIHPKILIELSPEEDLFIADEEYVKEFNEISKNESLLNVYSDSKDALKILQ